MKFARERKKFSSKVTFCANAFQLILSGFYVTFGVVFAKNSFSPIFVPGEIFEMWSVKPNVKVEKMFGFQKSTILRWLSRKMRH